MIFDKMLSTSTVESNVDVNFYTSWKDGYLVFKKQNIRDVLNVLSQYYNVHFVTGSRIDINRNITGKLELKESFEDVMQVMSDLAFINYTITGNNVEVTSLRSK
jgi:ferric-dicitrate binding protein FerR (iron transport regulator)